MKEVKTPKKPLLFYYGIVMLVIFLFNMLISPLLFGSMVVEVDYGTFMGMIEEKTSAAFRWTVPRLFSRTRKIRSFIKQGQWMTLR